MMKTSLETNTKFLADIARRFDISEINLASPVIKDGATKYVIEFAVRGQWSMWVKSAEMDVRIGNDGMARVNVHFDLLSGGSNGFAEDFIIMTADRYGQQEYEGVMSVRQFHFARDYKFETR